MYDADRDQFITQNLPLVQYVLNTYYTSSRMDEDLFQEGCIGLIKAADAWKSELGGFSTYAVPIIRSYISNSLRKTRAAKRKPDQAPLSLDAFFYDGSYQEKNDLYDLIVGEDSIERFIEKDTALCVIQWLLENLPELYKNVLLTCIEYDFHQQTVGDVLGLAQCEVSRKLKKIREIVTNYMDGKYDEESEYQRYKWFVDKSNSYYRPKGETK